MLEHEYWKEHLPEISICSDGITVDTTPPSPGNVWLYHKEAVYQVSYISLQYECDIYIDLHLFLKRIRETGECNQYP